MKHTKKVAIIPIEKYDRIMMKINQMEESSVDTAPENHENKQMEGEPEIEANISQPHLKDTSPPEKKSDWMDYFPRKLQFKASIVFKYIKDSAVLGWNSLGELTVKGRPVRGSHIVDLVRDIISSKRDNKPVGFNEFYGNLQNIPISLVKNKARIAILQEGRGFKASGPPPGLSNSSPVSLEDYYTKKKKKKKEKKSGSVSPIHWKKLY
jgi:hypothetical protein